ncbi:MAG: hypothetical protein WBL95_26160, partial [Microcoleus sp.]
ALCPMPYALCPISSLHRTVTEKGYITEKLGLKPCPSRTALYYSTIFILYNYIYPLQYQINMLYLEHDSKRSQAKKRNKRAILSP